MTDYHSPTVVTPELPACDVTPLERMLLGRIFDVPGQREGRLYFAAPLGPEQFFDVCVDNLHAALELSVGFESRLNDHVRALLAADTTVPSENQPRYIGIDFTVQEMDWFFILQDIVRRSTSLDEIVVWTAFTCTKMRSDGFGGSVTRITADTIQHASTDQMLETMRQSSGPVPSAPTDSHETRRRIEAAADIAGWDSFTLLLLISRWIDGIGQSEALIDHLEALASAEDA